MADSIPIVDLTEISLIRNSIDIDDMILRKVGTEIKDAFRTYGFCYFTNHGIEQEIIDELMSAGVKYFKLPIEEKLKLKTGTVTQYMGYLPLECEAVNRERPRDYREGFLYHPMFDELKRPTKFIEANRVLFEKCVVLAQRIMDALSLALGIDVSILRDSVKSLRTPNNMTSIRSSYYPPIQLVSQLKQDQIGCGEHSDYGSMTFVFQDDVGGLEVKSTTGEYIPAIPKPGTIVANIGDLMQRWTSDTLRATKHRVIVPSSNRVRQSLAFFVVPDNDCLITCVDGSEKYAPITTAEYLKLMMY